MRCMAHGRDHALRDLEHCIHNHGNPENVRAVQEQRPYPKRLRALYPQQNVQNIRAVGHMDVPALNALPAAKVKGAAVQKVKVAWGQEVSHQHQERRQPRQAHVLPHPPRVVVESILKTTTKIK